MKLFAKLGNSIFFSIIIPFNSIIARELGEFLSPDTNIKFLFSLLLARFRAKELKITIKVIERKIARVLRKVFKKIAILFIYRKIKKN